jgi:DNA-binding response OmpR family regulator
MRLGERTPSKPSSGVTATHPSDRPERVLIVDDEPNVRFVFKTALESAGFSAAEAADGFAAIDRLERSPADVVLLDLQMPGIGGMEVLRRLRDAGSDVPVVIVTAHGSIPDAVAAMRLGAIDFLTKPLTPDALRQVVAQVAERHAAAGPPANPTTVVTLGPAVVDLTPVKLALNRREFDRAADLLETALDADPASAEAHTLMGVLQESRGRDHAAYHSYKSALAADPGYGPARDNMRRYCERFGLDFTNKAINPAAEG